MMMTKVNEMRILRWNSGVKRMKDEHVVRRMLDVDMP